MCHLFSNESFVFEWVICFQISCILSLILHTSLFKWVICLRKCRLFSNVSFVYFHSNDHFESRLHTSLFKWIIWIDSNNSFDHRRSPEKMTLEMVIRMEIKILHGQSPSLSWNEPFEKRLFSNEPFEKRPVIILRISISISTTISSLIFSGAGRCIYSGTSRICVFEQFECIYIFIYICEQVVRVVWVYI